MSSEKDWQIRIEHVLDAIAKIQRYATGLTESTFAGNDMAVDAIIRNFQVIGEAVRHVPDEVRARHAEVPWSLMQGMRNILVHNYFSVKLDIVWRTIHDSLPPLVEPLKNVLKTSP